MYPGSGAVVIVRDEKMKRARVQCGRRSSEGGGKRKKEKRRKRGGKNAILRYLGC